MRIALLLHHGVRPDAPSEVMGRPHLELLGSTPAESDRLKVLADQLRAFGAIPFSYKELDSADQTLHGCVLRIALCERAEANPPGAVDAPGSPAPETTGGNR